MPNVGSIPARRTKLIFKRQSIMNKLALANLKSLPYGGAQYVVNAEREQFVRDAIKEVADDCLFDTAVHTRFIEEYRQWITAGTLNVIQGLEQFPREEQL